MLFSALGGQLADKYPKEKILRTVKIAEIGIAALGAASAAGGRSVVLSFATIFALGTHSAFFGPGKYSILPQHLEHDELIGGNALLNTGTFLAILAGTIAGTTLIVLPSGKLLVSVMLFAVAGAGLVSSFFIPSAPPPVPSLKISHNFLKETWRNLHYTFGVSPAR